MHSGPVYYNSTSSSRSPGWRPGSGRRPDQLNRQAAGACHRCGCPGFLHTEQWPMTLTVQKKPTCMYHAHGTLQKHVVSSAFATAAKSGLQSHLRSTYLLHANHGRGPAFSVSNRRGEPATRMISCKCPCRSQLSAVDLDPGLQLLTAHVASFLSSHLTPTSENPVEYGTILTMYEQLPSRRQHLPIPSLTR